MADQHRWFKFWTTAPYDDGLQLLPPEVRWAWVVLGAYTKANGTHGTVSVSPSNAALCGAMCVKPSDLVSVIKLFPHVRVEEGTSVNGTVSVTWENWLYYQEDRTVAERVKRLRSKRRGDKKRGDETRSTALRAVAQQQHASGIEFHIPASVTAALDRAPTLGRCPGLRRPQWWQAELRANPGVDLAGEVLKAEAWMTANPARAPKKSHERFLHSWLGRANRTET